MIGFPFLGGFTSKINFAMAGMGYGGWHMVLVLIVLAISTLLNVFYFMRTVITLYRKPLSGDVVEVNQPGYAHGLSLVCFIAVNLMLGLWAEPVLHALVSGLQLFA